MPVLTRRRAIGVLAGAGSRRAPSLGGMGAQIFSSAPVHLEVPAPEHAHAFLEAVRRSRSLHRGLVSPPRDRAQYRAYLDRLSGPFNRGHFVCLADGALAGVINVNEIVRGVFQSGYLGFYAFAPHGGRGHMSEGLKLVIARAFNRCRLHRLEANIQPGNVRSIALVERLGFRREGVSPRYLKIGGRWRDHERWAITVEDWRRRPDLATPRRQPIPERPTDEYGQSIGRNRPLKIRQSGERRCVGWPGVCVWLAHV